MHLAPVLIIQRTTFKGVCLNPQADSLLFAAVLLLLQPIQVEEVDPVFQIGLRGV